MEKRPNNPINPTLTSLRFVSAAYGKRSAFMGERWVAMEREVLPGQSHEIYMPSNNLAR